MVPCKFTGSRTRPKRRFGGKYIWIERDVLEQKLGRPIKDGMLACHTCGNELCIEPEHLYEGTYSSNAKDAGVGRWHRPRRTHVAAI
jgi:hypothetical protein